MVREATGVVLKKGYFAARVWGGSKRTRRSTRWKPPTAREMIDALCGGHTEPIEASNVPTIAKFAAMWLDGSLARMNHADAVMASLPGNKAAKTRCQEGQVLHRLIATVSVGCAFPIRARCS